MNHNFLQNFIWSSSLAKFTSLTMFSLFIIYCIFSGIIYKFFPHRYKGIKFTTKNITYIALLSAASVSMTIIVTYFVPITVLPPFRIAFEGLMIKITGLIFGPVVGVFSGFVTDMICILFIPSYFHIAYTITIVLYGFISGMTYVLNNTIKSKKFIMYIFSSIAILVFITIFTYFIQYFPVSGYTNGTSNTNPSIHLPLVGSIGLKDFLSIIVILSGTITFIFQNIMYIIYLVHNKSNADKRLFTVDQNIIPVMFAAVLTEYYISAIIAPWGDSSLFGHKAYSVILIYRIAEAPIKIFFNTAIIYLTYRTISPLINKDI